MSATKEKGRPAEGSPIPEVVLADATEPKASLLNLQVLRFDYGELAPDVAASLRIHSVRLRGLITKFTTDMIGIGRDLIAVKNRLEHGQFTTWVEAEIGISIRTAQGYIRFAVLAEGKSEIVSLFSPPTVRLLAAKSTSPAIVEQVITRAKSGNVVPEDIVKAMIHEDKFQKRETARQLRKNSRRRNTKAREAQKANWQAEQERERAARRAAAQSVIDRFSAEDIKFLVDTLDWGVIDQFRLLAERLFPELRPDALGIPSIGGPPR
jgi:hypothetical protein